MKESDCNYIVPYSTSFELSVDLDVILQLHRTLREHFEVDVHPLTLPLPRIRGRERREAEGGKVSGDKEAVHICGQKRLRSSCANTLIEISIVTELEQWLQPTYVGMET